ncbi:hypothetical protein FBULB1_11089 [Fusarium bulbicola]|nr:hypothetical protein FBULB1_11089 [Fusarium bulbicola]
MSTSSSQPPSPPTTACIGLSATALIVFTILLFPAVYVAYKHRTTGKAWFPPFIIFFIFRITSEIYYLSRRNEPDIPTAYAMVAAAASTATLSVTIIGIIYEALNLPLFPYKRQRNRIALIAMNVIYNIGTILAAYGGMRDTTMPDNIKNGAADKAGNIIMFLVMIGTLVWLYPAGKHIYYARQDTSYRSAEVLMMAAAPATVLQLIRMNYDLIYSFTQIAMLHPTTGSFAIRFVTFSLQLAIVGMGDLTRHLLRKEVLDSTKTYQNTMSPTEPTRQADISSLEDAISQRRDMVNQYMDLCPEVSFMQPMPPQEDSEKPALNSLEDAMLHLRLNWPNEYGKVYLEIALLEALKESCLDIVEELLEKAIYANSLAGDEQTSLFHTTELGFQEIVTSRLQQGASMDKKDEKGRTLLFQASHGGNIKIMSLLLASGAHVDLADKEGWTPLMVAAERGHDEAVALLLEHGADPSARDNDEFTALLHAAMIGYRGIVQRLLDAGADHNAQDEAESLTAISWAAENGHGDIVKLLLERGADPNLDDRVLLSALRGDSDALIELLIKHGADVFMDGWSDERPLVIASRQGRDLTVKMFLEATYSSESVRQEHIWDAITVAAEEGHETILARLMKHYEMNETEKQTKWKWVQESHFGDPLELLRPYFEADAISEKDGKEPS